MVVSSSSAVAYIRVAASEAPEPQQEAITTWAKREAIEVAAWTIDVGVDGATPIAERPGLLAAYNALRDKKAGILVAANAERFSHDELVAWLIERAALTEGAKLQTADGSHVAVGYTRGAIDLARSHSRVVDRERVRASVAERKAKGHRVGTVPYGQKLSADGVHLEPNESEQSVITLVQDLASTGYSQRAIVSELITRGITGRKGSALQQTQIANILKLRK